VKGVYVGRNMQDVQKLARLIVSESDDVIVLFVVENENRLQFVAAKGYAVGTSMKKASEVALPAINGKGGGKDAFVQGGGERTMTGNELLDKMVDSFH